MSGKSYDSSKHGKAPSPFIPLSFVALALLSFAATVIWALVALVPPLALLHAYAVGVFLTVALGLLYQFVPVVSMGTLRFPYLAYVHLMLAAAGTTFIVVGFANAAFGLVLIGGSLHAIGLALEAIVLAATVFGRIPPAATGSALASLAWLGLAIGLGVFVAHNLSHGIATGGLVRIHALAGLAGFFGTIIIGVTLRLLRMFERVDREAGITISSLSAHSGALISLVGGFANAALILAPLPFAAELLRVARARNPAYQRETLLYTACATIGAIFAAVAATLHEPFYAIVCALWIFVGTAEIGYLQRIVPFIWWIRRARLEGARAIPTLAEMNHSRLGAGLLVVWIAAGGAFLANPASKVAPTLALVAWLGLVIQLLRPFVLRKPVQAAP